MCPRSATCVHPGTMGVRSFRLIRLSYVFYHVVASIPSLPHRFDRRTHRKRNCVSVPARVTFPRRGKESDGPEEEGSFLRLQLFYVLFLLSPFFSSVLSAEFLPSVSFPYLSVSSDDNFSLPLSFFVSLLLSFLPSPTFLWTHHFHPFHRHLPASREEKSRQRGSAANRTRSLSISFCLSLSPTG